MTPPNNIVLADGCFDPLHVGHIAYLEAAARLGPLVVQVASDEAICAKGRNSFQIRSERVKTVESIKCVGFTVSHHSLSDAVRAVCPNVLAKGRDWIGKLPDDVVAACREVGTVIVYTDTQERTSTERLTPWLDPKFYRPDKLYSGETSRVYGYYRGDPGDENDAKTAARICGCGAPKWHK